jgi:hypothetical protein
MEIEPSCHLCCPGLLPPSILLGGVQKVVVGGFESQFAASNGASTANGSSSALGKAGTSAPQTLLSQTPIQPPNGEDKGLILRIHALKFSTPAASLSSPASLHHPQTAVTASEDHCNSSCERSRLFLESSLPPPPPPATRPLLQSKSQCQSYAHRIVLVAMGPRLGWRETVAKIGRDGRLQTGTEAGTVTKLERARKRSRLGQRSRLAGQRYWRGIVVGTGGPPLR